VQHTITQAFPGGQSALLLQNPFAPQPMSEPQKQVFSVVIPQRQSPFGSVPQTCDWPPQKQPHG
jgi:hypothetical protein